MMVLINVHRKNAKVYVLRISVLLVTSFVKEVLTSRDYTRIIHTIIVVVRNENEN